MSNTSSKKEENNKFIICCGGFGVDSKTNELVFITGDVKEIDGKAGEIVIPLEGEWAKTRKPRKKHLEKAVKIAEKEETTKRKPGRPKKTETLKTDSDKVNTQPAKRGRPRKEKVADGEER